MKYLLALVLAATMTLVAAEEEESPPASIPLMGEIDGNRYIVGPGDVLWFSIHGGIPGDSSGGNRANLLEITPDGYAVLPSVGAWKVSGLTLNEAAATVERGFASRYPGLTGIAGLSRMRVFQVPVTGHVNRPGIVQITGADGLVTVLEQAGGLASTGSMTGIIVVSSDGDTSRVNITDFLRFGEITANPYLSLGDRVHVPEAEDFVWMEGALRFGLPLAERFNSASEEMVWNQSSRGMTEYIRGETAGDLVSRVGGTAPWALRDSCYILRAGDGGSEMRIPAPLDDPRVDPLLLPGDVLVCPGVPPVVTVTGEVFAPGIYPHTAGMDAYFYINQAGGFVQASRRSGTSVTLPGGREVDADELRSVPAGSAISVPRKALIGWQDPLLILTSVASIVIAWKSIF